MPPTHETEDNYDYLLGELEKQAEYNEYLEKVNKLEISGHSNLLEDMKLDVQWSEYFNKLKDLAKLPKLNLSALDKSKPLPSEMHFRGKSLSIEELSEKVDKYNSQLEEKIGGAIDPFDVGIATAEGFKAYDEDDCLDYILSAMEEEQNIPFDNGETALTKMAKIARMWRLQGEALNGACKVPVLSKNIKYSEPDSSIIFDKPIKSSDVDNFGVTTTTTTTVRPKFLDAQWSAEDYSYYDINKESHSDTDEVVKSFMKGFLKSGRVKNNGR